MREMKDSGVEWIDEIPDNWSIVPLKTVVSFGKGLPITKENLTETGVPVVSYGQIHSKSNVGSHLDEALVRYVSDDYLKTNPNCLAIKGDIFVADTSEDYEGIGNSVLIDWDTEVFAGYHTVIVRPTNRIYSKYLSYLFMTDAWRSQLRSRASGIKVYSVTQGLLKKSAIIVPSENDVQSMTDYLDNKCTKINSIIEKQQAIIEKLKEYKLVIVSELITKGLNSNATMKDSGIEWIGMIPDNWEIKRLKYVTKIKYGTGHEKEWAEGSDDAEIILVNSKFISTEGKVVKNVAEQLLPLYQNDICTVLSDLPNGKALAKCFIIDKDNQYTLNQRIAAYYDYQLDREYFFWFMNRNRSLLDYDDGVNQTNLRNGDVRNCPVLIPPLEEQKQIGKKINEVIDAVDKKIIKAESIIEKLYEYKKSLIYEVVTGKKEV